MSTDHGGQVLLRLSVRSTNLQDSKTPTKPLRHKCLQRVDLWGAMRLEAVALWVSKPIWISKVTLRIQAASCELR
ncbi:hypothetical protein GX51_04562 [Blastomyces parvus]|uniref:Uncharacterized protein n=1 Tax=Blastomyces parvus TaxID=2060905 RepID=A0A2B7X0F5_9EURO|nr:hypothetical protein GX51_04562 [Blastomyces parvus]